MHALVLTDKNKPILFQDRAMPVLASGEALVKIYAAALNHRDVWIQRGLYAGLKYPIVPGSDGAGVVVKVAGAGQEDRVGREVIINPSMYWGAHPTHQDQHSFQILGLP